MKNILVFLIVLSFFELHTQTPETPSPKPNKMQNVGTVLFGIGFMMVAHATNLTPLYPVQADQAPAIYSVGLGLTLTGAAMLLLSQKKKNKQNVSPDLWIPSFKNEGQYSFKHLFRYEKKRS